MEVCFYLYVRWMDGYIRCCGNHPFRISAGQLGKKTQVLIHVLNPINTHKRGGFGDAYGHFSRPVGFHNPLVWVSCALLCSGGWAALGHLAPLSCSCSLCDQDTKLARNLHFWVRQDFYHKAGLGCYLAFGQAATTTWENLLWVILGVLL